MNGDVKFKLKKKGPGSDTWDKNFSAKDLNEYAVKISRALSYHKFDNSGSFELVIMPPGMLPYKIEWSGILGKITDYENRIIFPGCCA